MSTLTDQEIQEKERERIRNDKKYGFQFGKSDIYFVFDTLEKLEAIEHGYAETVSPSDHKYNSSNISRFMRDNDRILDQTRYALSHYLQYEFLPTLGDEFTYSTAIEEIEPMWNKFSTILSRIRKEEKLREDRIVERRRSYLDKINQLLQWFRNREPGDPMPPEFKSLADNRSMEELRYYSRNGEWPEESRE